MTDARTIINDNAELLETFVLKYLGDNGIGVQLVEVVAKALFGQQVVVNGMVHEEVAANPRDLVAAAIKDVAEVSVFSGMNFSLERLIAGGASLEFLVRYAHMVNPAVFPPAVIPSDEVVDAVLELFHKLRDETTID